MTDSLLNIIAAALVIGLVCEITPAMALLTKKYQYRAAEPKVAEMVCYAVVDLALIGFVIWRIFA